LFCVLKYKCAPHHTMASAPRTYIVRRDSGRIETVCGGGGAGTTDGGIGLEINTTARISN